MIEIKKKVGNSQLYTDTFDLMHLGVNFSNLSTNPYIFGTNYSNKIFIPLSTTLKYYSNGTQLGGFYISNVNVTGISNSFYHIFQSGTVPDQSGIVTLGQWGVDVTSYGNNDDQNTQLQLFTNVNELNASYTVFTLSITYYLINTL
jgi:hypothetical protein